MWHRAFAGPLALVGTSALVLALGIVPPAQGTPGPTDDLKHYTGQFHSHTSVSSDHPTTTGVPMDAWKHAADVSDLDFYAVTEHDVTYDVRNADINTEDWRDAVSDEWRLVNEQAEEFNKKVDETGLIAVPGTEHTWYNGSGHSNSFNTDWLVTAESAGDHSAVWGIGNLMFDLPMYYARLAKDPGALGQFNHPAPDKPGDFFGFNHLTPGADSRVNTIEVRDDDRFRDEYVKALDAGWHVAPVFGDDTHDDRWGEKTTVTGIWATEQSEEALYESFRNRTVYTTKDTNAQLSLRGNGEMMGAILVADVTSLELEIEATDPDAADTFKSLVVHSNGGEQVHTDTKLGNTIDQTVELAVEDGDYIWVEVRQADGDMIVSSPIWIGDRVEGANYAPEIDLAGRMPETAKEGQSVPLPAVRVKDDSDKRPKVETTVYNGEGEVEHDAKSFKISGYDDHYVVVRATDDQGSTATDYYRIQVSQDELDPATVYRHFSPTVNVGASAGEVGVSVPTDVSVEKAHLQYVPEGSDNWDVAQTTSTAQDQVFEVERQGREADTYVDSIGGQPLRSHDLDLTGLQGGQKYKYRLGVSESGPWTHVQGTFIAPAEENAPFYVLGDLEAESGTPEDYALFNDMLGVLREKDGRGEVLVQTGDFIAEGDRADRWDELFDQVVSDLDLPLATMVGDEESADKELHDISPERNAIFQAMYNHPKNGSEVGESTYSFDHGDVHVAVLNGSYDLKTQLEWLEKDMRSTDATWRVVAGHSSFFGGGHSDARKMNGERAMITDTFDQLGVDLYLGGHDHLYKRTTITDGKVATTPEEVAQGTTFVTVGSAGSEFDENQEFWWDDVVYDEDTQTGMVVDVTDEGLQLRAYNSAGETVDELTIGKNQSDHVKLSSAEVVDGELEVGLTGYANSPEQVVVKAESRDAGGETMIESRTQRVTLTRDGGEHVVVFDDPLAVEQDQDVVVEVTDLDGKVLVDASTVYAGFTGAGTATDPYVIHSWQQMELITRAPDAHYLLAEDLELREIPRPQIGRAESGFTGVFDGGGHQISGFVAEGKIGGDRYVTGAGLFAENAGTIRNLGLKVVDVKGGRIGGVLADVNSGTIERVWTAGKLSGSARLGGIVGNSGGVIRDSYSLVSVRTSRTESGGVLGVALSGSTTERVYATAAVSSRTNNSGGIAGYAYGGSTLHDSVALNPSVQAEKSAHAVLGRYAAPKPDLAGNYASGAMEVGNESYKADPAPDSPKGELVTEEQTKSQELFESTLGWDFEKTWEWNADLERPTLRAAPEGGTR